MRASRSPTWLSDGVLALVVSALVVGSRAVEIANRHLHDTSVAGLLLAIASALSLTLRRRWPRCVTTLTLGAVPAGCRTPRSLSG